MHLLTSKTHRQTDHSATTLEKQAFFSENAPENDLGLLEFQKSPGESAPKLPLLYMNLYTSKTHKKDHSARHMQGCIQKMWLARANRDFQNVGGKGVSMCCRHITS